MSEPLNYITDEHGVPVLGAGGVTGKIRYRDGWRGRLVLQVECERVDQAVSPSGKKVDMPNGDRYYRDAREGDLAQIQYINDWRAYREGTASGNTSLKPPPPPERHFVRR